MNFTLSNIIGSTLDPRPQVILQKNLSVILRYDEVCSLPSKLIHNCDKNLLIKNDHAKLSSREGIDC